MDKGGDDAWDGIVFGFGLAVCLLGDADGEEGCVNNILLWGFSAFFAHFPFFVAHYTCDQRQCGLNLVHFQRSTRDPHCILSCLVAHLRCGRERENCVWRELMMICGVGLLFGGASLGGCWLLLACCSRRRQPSLGKALDQ